MAKRIEIPKGATVRKFNRAALPPAARASANESELELTLYAACRLFAIPKGLPIPERQAVVVEGRGWRWDLAFPDSRLGIEVQGGTYLATPGKHSRGCGQSKDFAKLNAAALEGWTVLQFDSAAIDSMRIVDSVELIYATLAAIAIRKAAQG
jgi:hypothetical protein